MSLLKKFNKPYPVSENNWKLIFLISLFVALFLLIFQPFGLQHYRSEHKVYVITGYGLVTLLILIINLILLKKIFPGIFHDENWKLWKHVLWMVWLLLTIGLANYVYSIIMIANMRSNVYTVLFFLVITIIVGIFPITFLTVIQENRLLRKHVRMAGQASKEIGKPNESKIIPSEQIVLSGDNQAEEISVLTEELLYIESEGNYVSVCCTNKGGNKKTLIRATLKKIEEQLKQHPAFMRCHRAYIVNLTRVIDISGNAQGYRLKLSGAESVVPVSRGYLNAFNQSIILT